MTRKKNRPPQVALVGAGYWGKNLARDLSALGALRTVCDPDPAVRAKNLSDRPGLKAVATLGEALLDDEIKAVVIAAPAPLHCGLTLEALAAGRDVLVEKPLALSVADGEKMAGAARLHDRILMVDHLLNRHPAYRELRAKCLKGELGPRLLLGSRRHNFGKLRTDENVLWSFAPHDVAMILGIAGPPKRVFATGGGGVTPGVEDWAEGTLEYGDGPRAHVSVSWVSPEKEQRLTVAGSRMTAVFDDTAPWEKKLRLFANRVDRSSGRPEAVRDPAGGTAVPLEKVEPLLEQCKLFLECVETRKQPDDSGPGEALQVLGVLLALDKSLKSGRWESLE
ncbi:MAG: Gfo/Idh/MocA family oxidoreductase [Deltaproteobacteria bacterium]|jgi:UDP-2-acetamido-3-amino-2,3-dideoxy-glucuronate N-acetyltransferase|nr:Gfo/Idh/MocA family oxidoreductase [Deltaproteobacteria bacterium]